MNSTEYRKQLVKHLRGGEAFMPIDDIIEKIPFEKLGDRPSDLPYSFYEIFYHIKYAQKDILDFCVSGTYKTPNWPDDYWPDSPTPENEASWKKLKENYFQDRELFASFILNEENELLEPVKNGEDQSLLREVMLVVEHGAYHTGQLLIISRLLGAYSA
ncbi:DinB family protein [Salegentibacter sp.]|uniref:DinB family protein n=1 Tax=Salegentibacter sp. TaxID=1903072 RepID=UPI0035670566